MSVCWYRYYISCEFDEISQAELGNAKADIKHKKKT